MKEYLKFVAVPREMLSGILAILLFKKISCYKKFLSTKWLSPEKLESWGIPYGIGMDLMDKAESFSSLLEEVQGENVFQVDCAE